MLTKLPTICVSSVAAGIDAVAVALVALTRPPTGGPIVEFALDTLRSRSALIAENALLRQQLIVARRSLGRPRFRNRDRLLLVLLVRFNQAWRQALHLLQPDTLLRWHRDLFTIIWRRKSRTRNREPRVPQAVIDLVRTMAAANLTWGAERIRGELFKLGIMVSKRTVQRYMRSVRGPRASGQRWKTFLENHATDVWACDFLQTFDLFFRPLFAFFIIEHATRRVVHVNVTRCPTDGWVAQQLREAIAFNQGPRFLIRDNDDKFGTKFASVARSTNIKVLRTPVKAPLVNAICERFLGSVRRECLDHFLLLGEQHARRVLCEYASYFGNSRPHQSLGQKTPDSVANCHDNCVPLAPRASGEVVSVPVLGGLHHEYRLAA